MEDKIKEVLEEIRPSLQRDGGDLEFVRFENGKVEIKLTGACHGCFTRPRQSGEPQRHSHSARSTSCPPSTA